MFPFCVAWNSLFQEFFTVVLLYGSADVRYFCRTFGDLFFITCTLKKYSKRTFFVQQKTFITHTQTTCCVWDATHDRVSFSYSIADQEEQNLFCPAWISELVFFLGQAA
jgi:hypothetical protein